MPARPLRLVLVDDHEMVLHGLTAMLGHFVDDVEITGTATTGAEARSLISRDRPDIVLSDVRIGRDSGIDLAADIAASSPDTKVVMLTVYDDEHYLFQALRVGVRGYILKRIDGRQLVDHLQRVAEGDVVIDAALAGRVALSAAKAGRGDYWPGANLDLTQRESEVLQLLVAGHSNKAIASQLVVSEDTVKTHLRGLYRKLEVNDRAGATAVALREGLFK